jgi:hypothetical protein
MSEGELPEPLVPAYVDLRDFPFMPVDINRLFGSEFHARASDGEWRAGFTLWLKSWHQQPAASLPSDDVGLCRLAELGRDLKSWARVRDMALYGWIKCSDGRLYHPVVAEKALESWAKKRMHRDRTVKAREAKDRQRRDRERDEDVKASVTEHATDTDTEHVEEPVTTSSTGSKGQGEGKKEGSEAKASGTAVPPRTNGNGRAEPVHDPASDWWRASVAGLIGLGVPERQARSLIGKWRKTYPDDEVMAAIETAASEAAANPIPFVLRVLETRHERVEPMV